MGLPLSRLGLHSQIPLILHRLFLDPLLRVSKFFYHLRSGIAVGVGGMPPPCERTEMVDGKVQLEAVFSFASFA